MIKNLAGVIPGGLTSGQHVHFHFPLGGIFSAERHFLLFKYELAESEHQKTKENIIPRGKFCLVENDPDAFS